MSWRNFFLLAVVACASVSAREWRSADGARTLEAQFAGVKEDKLLLKDKDGKATVYPASAFSKEDQQFAQQAQVILAAAVVAGALSMQVDQLLPEGSVCRVIKKLPVEKETWIATGAPFLVLRSDQLAVELGARVMDQMLYHAGTRNFQAVGGKSTLINAYSVSLDDAVDAALRLAQAGAGDAAKVQEPRAKMIVVRGMALPLGSRHVMAEAGMLKDASTISLHCNGKEVPASVVQVIEPLDLALLSCETELGPRKLLPRKPLASGQKITVVAFALASDGRSFVPTARTAGSISRFVGEDLFEHDATIPANSKGGYVLDDKGDVIGIFFSHQSRMLGGRSSEPAASAADQPVVAGLSDCIRIESLEKWLPESEKQTPGIPWMKRGMRGDVISQAAEELRQSSWVVVATSGESKATPKAVGTQMPAGGGAGPATGWSLSKSGTRHNDKCRFYNAALPCKAADGKPCKVCGG